MLSAAQVDDHLRGFSDWVDRGANDPMLASEFPAVDFSTLQRALRQQPEIRDLLATVLGALENDQEETPAPGGAGRVRSVVPRVSSTLPEPPPLVPVTVVLHSYGQSKVKGAAPGVRTYKFGDEMHLDRLLTLGGWTVVPTRAKGSYLHASPPGNVAVHDRDVSLPTQAPTVEDFERYADALYAHMLAHPELNGGGKKIYAFSPYRDHIVDYVPQRTWTSTMTISGYGDRPDEQRTSEHVHPAHIHWRIPGTYFERTYLDGAPSTTRVGHHAADIKYAPQAPPVSPVGSASSPADPSTGETGSEIWMSPAYGRVEIVLGAKGRHDVWHNIRATVGGIKEQYGYNGRRWSRGDKRPPPELLQEVAEHGFGEVFGVQPAPRPALVPVPASPSAPAFKVGDRVVDDSGRRGVVEGVGSYDDFLGMWRYHVRGPDGTRLWWNGYPEVRLDVPEEPEPVPGAAQAVGHVTPRSVGEFEYLGEGYEATLRDTGEHVWYRERDGLRVYVQKLGDYYKVKRTSPPYMIAGLMEWSSEPLWDAIEHAHEWMARQPVAGPVAPIAPPEPVKPLRDQLIDALRATPGAMNYVDPRVNSDDTVALVIKRYLGDILLDLYESGGGHGAAAYQGALQNIDALAEDITRELMADERRAKGIAPGSRGPRVEVPLPAAPGPRAQWSEVTEIIKQQFSGVKGEYVRYLAENRLPGFTSFDYTPVSENTLRVDISAPGSHLPQVQVTIEFDRGADYYDLSARFLAPDGEVVEREKVDGIDVEQMQDPGVVLPRRFMRTLPLPPIPHIIADSKTQDATSKGLIAVLEQAGALAPINAGRQVIIKSGGYMDLRATMCWPAGDLGGDGALFVYHRTDDGLIDLGMQLQVDHRDGVIRKLGKFFFTGYHSVRPGMDAALQRMWFKNLREEGFGKGRLVVEDAAVLPTPKAPPSADFSSGSIGERVQHRLAQISDDVSRWLGENGFVGYIFIPEPTRAIGMKSYWWDKDGVARFEVRVAHGVDGTAKIKVGFDHAPDAGSFRGRIVVKDTLSIVPEAITPETLFNEDWLLDTVLPRVPSQTERMGTREPLYEPMHSQADRSRDAEARRIAKSVRHPGSEWVLSWEGRAPDGSVLYLLEVPNPRTHDDLKYLLVMDRRGEHRDVGAHVPIAAGSGRDVIVTASKAEHQWGPDVNDAAAVAAVASLPLNVERALGLAPPKATCGSCGRVERCGCSW